MANFKKHSTGWEYRVKYKDPFTQQNKEKSQRGFASKQEAKIAAAEFEAKIRSGFEQDGTMSLEMFLDYWIEEYKKGLVRKNTLVLHESNIKNHIKPYFKKINLHEIKPIMYQKFLNSLTEKYSKRTVELIHSTFYGAMDQAVILNKIEKNPCVGSIVKGKKKDKSIQFLESRDIPFFLKSAFQYGYIYWIFFKVLIETGMRKGEAAALQWTDINFNDGTISISKTLDFTAKTRDELFGDPKTYNSIRKIKMSNSLTNDLKYHRNYLNQNKIALNDIYYHDLNLVLCRDNGNFIPKSSLFNAFSRILAKADLPDIPIHALRHTHAVLLLEAGAEMKYVQERLGHGSISITSDVYAHISKKIENEQMKKYEEYINFGGNWGATHQK